VGRGCVREGGEGRWVDGGYKVCSQVGMVSPGILEKQNMSAEKFSSHTHPHT
jgi:hypothetical protein